MKGNTEALSCNHCCRGQAINITYSECVFVALAIQHECACAVLLSVACPAVRYFSTLSHKRHDFRKKNIDHEVCDLILFTLSEKFLILGRTEQDMIQYTYLSSCKVPLFWSDFNEISIFLTDFGKILISNCMKIRKVEAELFHEDGQTDLT
jgi:hypothetical protein